MPNLAAFVAFLSGLVLYISDVLKIFCSHYILVRIFTFFLIFCPLCLAFQSIGFGDRPWVLMFCSGTAICSRFVLCTIRLNVCEKLMIARALRARFQLLAI